MFIGHYSSAFVLKKVRPEISLGWCFIFAQFVDLVFSVLVLTGHEHLNLTPGFTETYPFDLWDIPFSHSLVSTIFWSSLVGFIWWRYYRSTVRILHAAVWVGLTVSSHFFLDFFVHVPDLPLTLAGETKIGLGLWNNRTLSIIFETGVLAASMIYAYQHFTKENKPSTKLMLYSGFLFIFCTAGPFLPVAESVASHAIQGLVLYLVLAFVAHKVDYK